jgi:hypothetical protein
VISRKRREGSGANDVGRFCSVSSSSVRPSASCDALGGQPSGGRPAGPRKVNLTDLLTATAAG